MFSWIKRTIITSRPVLGCASRGNQPPEEDEVEIHTQLGKSDVINEVRDHLIELGIG